VHSRETWPNWLLEAQRPAERKAIFSEKITEEFRRSLRPELFNRIRHKTSFPLGMRGSGQIPRTATNRCSTEHPGRTVRRHAGVPHVGQVFDCRSPNAPSAHAFALKKAFSVGAMQDGQGRQHARLHA
jgi:hypothetical protein